MSGKNIHTFSTSLSGKNRKQTKNSRNLKVAGNYPYILIHLVFVIFHMENQNNQLQKLWILLFSTFDPKMTERPKIFLWLFSYYFGLTNQPLNSGACRKITLGTLTHNGVQKDWKLKFLKSFFGFMRYTAAPNRVKQGTSREILCIFKIWPQIKVNNYNLVQDSQNHKVLIYFSY